MTSSLSGRSRSCCLHLGNYVPDREELPLEFWSGKRATWSNVPLRIWRELCCAQGLGSYFNDWIKGYYERVPTP